MAYEIPGFMIGILPADADLSAAAKQFTGVCAHTAVNTTGTGGGGASLCIPSATTSPIIGVLQNNPLLGEAGTVMHNGVSKVLAGGTFQIGDLLMCQSDGKFVKATSTNYAVAQALETGASGSIVAALLVRNGIQ